MKRPIEFEECRNILQEAYNREEDKTRDEVLKAFMQGVLPEDKHHYAAAAESADEQYSTMFDLSWSIISNAVRIANVVADKHNLPSGEVRTEFTRRSIRSGVNIQMKSLLEQSANIIKRATDMYMGECWECNSPDCTILAVLREHGHLEIKEVVS